MLQCMRPQVTLSGSREIRLDRCEADIVSARRDAATDARSPSGVSARGIASIAAWPPPSSAIPNLHESLACNLPALEFDHCRTKHFRSVVIGTVLHKSEAVAYGDAAFDLVNHFASADVVKICRDGALAFQVARLARRIVTIDDSNNGILGIKAGKRTSVAAPD